MVRIFILSQQRTVTSHLSGHSKSSIANLDIYIYIQQRLEFCECDSTSHFNSKGRKEKLFILSDVKRKCVIDANKGNQMKKRATQTFNIMKNEQSRETKVNH